MAWVELGIGYLSGSLDDGWFKETWGHNGTTKTLTPVSASALKYDEKKCYDAEGNEKACTTLKVMGW